MEDYDREEITQIPPPSPFPWLLYTYSQGNIIQTFSTIKDNTSYIKNIPSLRGKHALVSSSHGWFVFAQDKNFYLWHPTTSNSILLPPLTSTNQGRCVVVNASVLTKNPNDDDDNNNFPCIVVFFCNYAVFSYCLNNPTTSNDEYKYWTCHNLEIHGKQTEIREAVIGDEGVIYALARTKGDVAGLAKYLVTLHVVIEGNKTSVMMQQCINLPVSPTYRYRDEHTLFSIIECCGQIYIIGICRIQCSKYERRVSCIKIWRLDLNTLGLVQVDCIDDRAFFLGWNFKGSGWCWASSEAGVEPNSVYFFKNKLEAEDEDDAYLYKLHDNSLTLLCSLPKSNESRGTPKWVIMPHHHVRSLSSEQCGVPQVPIKETNQQFEILGFKTLHDDFYSLPIHLVTQITMRLHLFDYLSVRETCKTFQKQLPLPQWRTHNSLPLFLFSNKDDGGLCRIMDPRRKDTRLLYVSLPTELEKFIDFSNKGWCLFGCGTHNLKYLNLFTREEGELPCFDQMQELSSIGFSTYPTSSDCLNVGIYGGGHVYIAYHFHGEKDWNVVDFWDGRVKYFGPATRSPVYVDGGFYFSDRSGHLAVFYFDEDKKPNMAFYHRPNLQRKDVHSNHILECDGDILSVFIGYVGGWIKLFKFEGEWIELEELENYALFISYSTSFAVKTSEPGTGNRIYLPRFYRNGIVYYSFETGKFHTIDGDHTLNDLYGTVEPLRCCWV